MPPPTHSDELVEMIRRSDILGPELLARLGPLPGEPGRAAANLVRRGFLTPFQAKLLLGGKYRGFAVGPYVVRDRIGVGGRGTVYLAQHRQLQRKVALKVLAGRTRGDRGVGRFLSAAQAAASLDHPNIVRVHDIADQDGLRYLVLEYVEGRTLGQMLAAAGPLSARRAVDFVAQAATGLQHAHERGFAHGDVRPANLIVSADGTLKLLDLGLARSATDPEREAIQGSADFLAPEQALDGAAIDARSDIYSLGATFCALVTGRPPFAGTTAQILLRHQLTTPPRLDEIDPTFPAPLADVAATMLAKKPADRYQTAAEVVAAVAPWMTGTNRLLAGLSGTRIGRGPESSKRVRLAAGAASTARIQRSPTTVERPPAGRRRWPIAAGALLALAAAALGGYVAVATAPEPAQPPVQLSGR